MASNRNKLIGQGLPGDANFRAGDVGDTQTIQWSTSENKWTATDFPTIDLGADYVWTGTHTFNGAVNVNGVATFTNTTNFNGTNNFGGTATFSDTATFNGSAVFNGTPTSFNAFTSFFDDAYVQTTLYVSGPSNNTEGVIELECEGTGSETASNLRFLNKNVGSGDHRLDIDCTRKSTNQGVQVRLFRNTNVGSDNAYFYIYQADGSSDLSLRHWVGTGFYSYENVYVEGKDLYVRNSSSQTSCRITQAGDMSLGSQSSSSTCTLDLHSSGRSTHDVRFSSSGGSSTSGRGDLDITANTIENYANSNSKFYVANDEKFRVAGAQISAYEPIVVDPPSSRSFALICDSPSTTLTTQIFRVRNTSGSTQMYVQANGSCYNSTGTYAQFSDEDYKEDIVPDTAGLAEINQLSAIKYRLAQSIAGRDTTGEPLLHGFSAQQVLPILPDIVDWHPEDTSAGTVTPGHYSVNVVGLIPTLVNAIKELTQRVEDLENGNPT